MLLVLRRNRDTADDGQMNSLGDSLCSSTHRWTVLLTYPAVRNCSASHAFTVIVASCGLTHFHSFVEG